MWQLLLSSMLVAASAEPVCMCLCVDGKEQTLCSGLEAAEQQPALCHGQLACLMSPTPAFEPEVFQSPREGAANCRSARVWQLDFEHHRIVKICDTIG